MAVIQSPKSVSRYEASTKQMATQFEQNKNLIVEAVDPELLILDTRSGKLHRLSPSAGVIWQLVGDGATAAHLVAQIQELYGISPEIAERDISHIIAEFLALDLIGYSTQEISDKE